MSEEELNQELSTDELKDVAGGYDPASSGSGIKRDPNTEEIITAHVGKDKSNKSLGVTSGGNGTMSAEDLGKECRGMGLDRLGTQ